MADNRRTPGEPPPANAPLPPGAAEGAGATEARVHNFVGRERELREICAPLPVDRAVTRVHWLCGPPGVGKTALLRHLHRVFAAGGADVTLQTGSISLAQAALPRPDGAMAGGHGRPRILLVDDVRPGPPWGDALASPPAPPGAAGMLLVVAARSRAPLSWRVRAPWWDIREHRLGPLSAREAFSFMRAAGASDADARLAHRQSAGFPLLLRLLSEPGSDPAAACLAAAAAIADELAWPPAREPLDALALALRASQQGLSAILGRRVATEEYEALARLSCVAVEASDLLLDPASAAVLRAALRTRDPARWQEEAERAVRALGESAARGRLQEKAARLHQLLTLRSAIARPAAPAAAEELWPPGLHLAGAGGSDGPSPVDGLPHTLRDVVAQLLADDPEAVQVARDSAGARVSWQLVVPIASLQRCGVLQACLGNAGGRQVPALFGDRPAFVLVRPPLAQTPDLPVEALEGVLDAAMLAAAGGAPIFRRSKDAGEREHLAGRGWRPLPGRAPDVLTLEGGPLLGPGETGARPAAAGSPASDDARDLLRHLNNLEFLADFARRRRWDLTGAGLRDLLLGTLIADQVPYPLTGAHQQLLRIAYVERAGNADAVARRLAVSRTTYYRQLGEALRFFALALRP